MPLYLKVAFKPTPSISVPQRSVNIKDSKEVIMKTEGRHDPCVVIRAVPVVEAVVAIGLLDLLLD